MTRPRRAMSPGPVTMHCPHFLFLLLFLVVGPICDLHANEDAIVRVAKVTCDTDAMKLKLSVDRSSIRNLYLRNMKGFPDPKCQPVFENATGANSENETTSTATFDMVLTNNYNKCGLIRIMNQKTKTVTYRHEVQVETKDNKLVSFPVKCVFKPQSSIRHTLSKRDVPFGFSEDEEIEIVSNITKYAPEPIISANVRQGGKVIENELRVAPGTPLQMEIFLDPDSSPIYGILVKHMSVSDAQVQDETLILDGCAIDSFLFENFKTGNGDFLTAKFKAFKFPETPYVMFFITVNVCLDKCQGIECSDDRIGYGRRRRREAADPLGSDPNKVFEVSFTSFLKMAHLSDLESAPAESVSDGRNDSSTENLAKSLREKLIYGQEEAAATSRDPIVRRYVEDSGAGSQTSAASVCQTTVVFLGTIHFVRFLISLSRLA